MVFIPLSVLVADPIDRLIVSLGSENSEVRIEAVHKLGKLKAKKAVPDLIKLLKDSDDKVKKASIFALNMIKDSSSVKPLLEVLSENLSNLPKVLLCVLEKPENGITSYIINSREEIPEYLLRSLRSFGSIGHPVLIDSISRYNSSDKRLAAILVLQYGIARNSPDRLSIVSGLQNLVTDDDDLQQPCIRSNAAIVLGQMESDAIDAIPTLLNAVKDDESVVVNNAVWALGRIGSNNKLSLEKRIMIFSKLKEFESDLSEKFDNDYGGIIKENFNYALKRINVPDKKPALDENETEEEVTVQNIKKIEQVETLLTKIKKNFQQKHEKEKVKKIEKIESDLKDLKNFQKEGDNEQFKKRLKNILNALVTFLPPPYNAIFSALIALVDG